MRKKSRAKNKKRGFWQKSTFQLIFLLAAMLLLVMPFVTTFNEVLTKIVERIQFYTVIQSYVVPYISRIIGLILMPFGLKPIGTATGLMLPEQSLNIQIAWNCIGWQSLLLLVITLFTGLQGSYSKYSKINVILVGICGTFLVNIIRITSVTMMAVGFGQFPAIIFHDYFGNLLIIIWLFAFWWYSFSYVLEPVPFEIETGKRLSKKSKRLKTLRKFIKWFRK